MDSTVCCDEVSAWNGVFPCWYGTSECQASRLLYDSTPGRPICDPILGTTEITEIPVPVFLSFGMRLYSTWMLIFIPLVYLPLFLVDQFKCCFLQLRERLKELLVYWIALALYQTNDLLSKAFLRGSRGVDPQQWQKTFQRQILLRIKCALVRS